MTHPTRTRSCAPRRKAVKVADTARVASQERGTLRQTPVLISGALTAPPTAMAFCQGMLWLATVEVLYAADTTNLAGDFPLASYSGLTTQLYFLPTGITGILSSRLACVPGPTVACLYNRFQIEVAYDAGRGNGRKPASVVLHGRLSARHRQGWTGGAVPPGFG